MKDIVNKEKQKEIINQVLDFLNCDEPTTPILEYLEDEFKEINKNSRDIGLKDINGKNIYADCSIVEFKFGTGGEYHKMTGYFSYNNQTLRYEIKDVNKREAIYLWSGYIEKEIKIIDSIQENKL